MSAARRIRGALAVTLALTTGACLPRGDAPAGRQILADKTAVLAGFVPPNGDGVVRVLFFRPGKDADNVNLWTLAVDPNGGPSTERMLIPDISTGLELGYRPSATNPGFPMDAQGRVTYRQFVPGADFNSDTVDEIRADPVTGEVVDLGQPPNTAEPPNSYMYPTVSNYTGAPLLFDQNGGLTISDVDSYGFGGTTAFYLTTAGALFSLDTTGASRALANGVATFFVISAQTVLITRAVVDPGMTEPPPETDPLGGPSLPPQVTGALLDTATLAETPLPDGLQYQYAYHPSPSGRWLIVRQTSQDPNQPYGSGPVLLDTTTGAIEVLEPAFSSNATWRPGHDELWSTSVNDPDQTGLLSKASLSIKKPGLPTVTVPGVYFTHFSTDGLSWFSLGASLTAQASSDLVGLADDPTGPRYGAVPAGSSLGSDWAVGDGRVLCDATVGPDSFENSYVQFVDPRNGATQLVGELGYLSVVGTTRALGVYHVSYLRGDLTTTDFTTGQATILAAEFAVSAVAEAQGTDLYPPGGRIVYQFDSHFGSPWDGLWLATVP